MVDAATFAWLNQANEWCVPVQLTTPCRQQTITLAMVSILQRETVCYWQLHVKGIPISKALSCPNLQTDTVFLPNSRLYWQTTNNIISFHLVFPFPYKYYKTIVIAWVIESLQYAIKYSQDHYSMYIWISFLQREGKMKNGKERGTSRVN